MGLADLILHWLLQLAVIVVAARLLGGAARLAGQPRVVGEMLAGVLLGPTLFGWLAPTAHAALFAPAARPGLAVVAQFGIGLYMFLVGVEFETQQFRLQARRAAAVSLAGVMGPCVLAILLTPWLRAQPGMFGESAGATETALFLSATLAVTAFPMLARILDECGQTGTPLGTLALAAGASGDAVAWALFAVALAVFGEGAGVAIRVIGGGLLYATLMLTLGRRWLAPLGPVTERAGKLTAPMLAGILALLALAAWFTDATGIHTVFGGFLLGVALPRGLLTRELRRKLEPVSTLVLLPVFFAFSGQNTRLAHVSEPGVLGLALLLLAVACLGKFGACWAAARATGTDQRLALALGALMNARGLMGLILLNTGLQRGLIQPPLFALLVLMVVVTTLLAAPLFGWFYGRPKP